MSIVLGGGGAVTQSGSTMLALVQEATGELGLSIPSTVVGNTNTDVTQIYRLINACGYEIYRKHQWQALTTEYRFTTVFYSYTANTTSGSTSITNLSSTTGLTTNPTYFSVTGTGIDQDTYLSSVDSGASTAVLSRAATATGTGVTLTFTQTKYAFPSDYDRLVDRTEWDKTQHWEALGPETGQQWQWLKSGFISTGPRVRFRPLGGLFQIWPAIGAAHMMGFEYVSKNWANASTGTAQASFQADTDTCVFPDRLMVLALKHKYWTTKGFAQIFKEDYEAELNLAIAHDAGSPTLSLNPRVADILLSWNNIPDSGYGS